MNASDVRTAHKLLDRVSQGRAVLEEEISLIRSFLPEPPKQKTLAELAELVNEAWGDTQVNDWDDDTHGSLEGWLSDLEMQLRGLADVAPELPAGMRIAVHAVYGRVVVSPVVDDDDTCKIFHLSTDTRDGSDYCWTPIDSLTFIDYEPAKPAHPEFLQTGAEYQEAPWGTIVAMEDSLIVWVKKDDSWSSTDGERRTESQFLWGVPRKVLRWGEGA